MDIIALMLLLMLCGCGIYSIITCLRLRKQWQLTDNKIMLPGNCTAASCVDPDGFLEFMTPKMLLFGFALLILGLLYLPGILYSAGVLALSQTILSVLDIAIPVVTIAVFVWFILVQRKAAMLFW